jgi:hypothetical protein
MALVLTITLFNKVAQVGTSSLFHHTKTPIEDGTK